MSKTRAQLVARALHKLGVIGAGQAPSAEDAALVDTEIGPVMADLAVRNVYQWGDEDEIDDAAFVHLADVVANSVAPDFGQPQDEVKRISAENRLRLLDPQMLSGQPVKVEYF
jgi:hypothetical protein